MALARVAQCPESITTELCRLSAESLAPSHMALLLEIAADAAEHRLAGGVPVSLVWTGPECAASQSRDTAVVVEELFAHRYRWFEHPSAHGALGGILRPTAGMSQKLLRRSGIW
jgi:hypothetical protein